MLIFFCAFFYLPGGAVRAAETPETILIRQALNNEKFGLRRGDIELVLSAFAEQMVVYEGHHRADPRGWSVLHADRTALAAALEDVAATHRKGSVTHRLQRHVLWTLSLRAGAWQVTRMFYNLRIPQ